MKIFKKLAVLLGILLITTTFNLTSVAPPNPSALSTPHRNQPNQWASFSTAVESQTVGNFTDVPLQLDTLEVRIVASSNPSGDASPSPDSPGTITVYGYWQYIEQDGTTARAARFATVALWDSEPGGGRVQLETATTDENGYYQFPPVENADCCLFEGTLDPFVTLIADADFATVTDYALQATYAAYGATLSNVPDGYVDMGTQQVIGDTRGAWAILDSIYNGWSFTQNNSPDHFSPVHVTARWDGSTRQTETTSPTEIHFSWGDQWDEDVIIHEYAHAVQSQIYGTFPAIPDSTWHHSFTEHSNQNTAFAEGWAHFFAVAANFQLAAGDALAPRDTWLRSQRLIVNFNLETWNIDVSCGTQAFATVCDDVEGVVATILWDVYDQPNDDQSVNWMGSDTLSVAGTTPIFDVIMNSFISGHRPYTIHDFWTGWFARGHGLPERIWGIYNDHGISKDTTAPSSAVSSLPSTSSTSFTVTWSGTDDFSGIMSYDIQYHDTTVGGPWTDWMVGTTLTSGTFSGSCNHTYEFRSRARDNAGNIEGYPLLADASTMTPCGGGSVAHGTLIMLSNGRMVPIQNVAAGDWVVGYDTESGRVVVAEVLQVHQVVVDNMVIFRLSDGTTIRTDNNPLQRFWVRNLSGSADMVGVPDILVDDYLFNVDQGIWVQIVDKSYIAEGKFTMYDLATTFPDYGYTVNGYLDPSGCPKICPVGPSAVFGSMSQGPGLLDLEVADSLLQKK